MGSGKEPVKISPIVRINRRTAGRFELQRKQCYAALNFPQDAESFLGGVQREMSEALTLRDFSARHEPELAIEQDPKSKGS